MPSFPSPPSLRRRRYVLLPLVAIGCGLPRKQDVDMAQTVYELGVAMQDMQQNQADLIDRIDSLAIVLTRQDSTIRMLANLLGSPLPPR